MYSLLYGKIVRLDLSVDSTLGLGGSVLILQVLEAAGSFSSVGEPDLVLDLLGAVHVSEGGVSHVVEGVIGHVVLAAVGPAVLKAPHGERVHLLPLPHGQSRTLGTVIATTSVDPAVRVLLLEGTVHGLDLAKHIISINILHPVITAILLVVVLLVSAALGSVDLGLEAVVL